MCGVLPLPVQPKLDSPLVLGSTAQQEGQAKVILLMEIYAGEMDRWTSPTCIYVVDQRLDPPRSVCDARRARWAWRQQG
jgi:hypothetical protein